MTKFQTLCLLSFFVLFSSQAQQFEIKGKVVDAISKSPLEAATVYMESIKDSSLITYSITDQKGNFLLDGKTNLKLVNVFFSYNGYETVAQRIVPKAQMVLGNVLMNEKAQQLKGVQVVAD